MGEDISEHHICFEGLRYTRAHCDYSFKGLESTISHSSVVEIIVGPLAIF